MECAPLSGSSAPGTLGTAEAPSHVGHLCPVLSCSLCPHARRPWESGFSLGSSKFPSVEPPLPASHGPGEMESASRPPGPGRCGHAHSDLLSRHSDHQESPRAAAWRTRRRLALPRAHDAPRVPSRQSCQLCGTETSACRAGWWEGRPGPRPSRKPKAPSAPWTRPGRAPPRGEGTQIPGAFMDSCPGRGLLASL